MVVSIYKIVLLVTSPGLALHRTHCMRILRVQLPYNTKVIEIPHQVQYLLTTLLSIKFVNFTCFRDYKRSNVCVCAWSTIRIKMLF